MKGLMLLMGAKPKGGADSSDEDDAPPSSGDVGGDSKAALGNELWSAFEDKDKAGFLAALDAYIDHCMNGGDEDDKSDEE
jgi:hypothetical protein